MPHIVINVPEPAGTIFLVRCGDADNDTQRLEDDIIVAASSSGLWNPQYDQNINGLNHILPAISASQVVVAFCAMNHSFATPPSPQVMYQLGFARCLGKALLVLAQTGQTIPGVVEDRDVFAFSSAEVGSPALRNRLSKAINAAKTRTNPHHIVDQVYFPQIWASQRHNWLSGPDFFDVFVNVSIASHSATRLSQRMIHEQVDPLLRAVDEV